jgi:AraC-like DNA-binding protein
VLTNALVDLNDITSTTLNQQLMETRYAQDCIALMMEFLRARLKQDRAGDTLIEESLRLIHTHIESITVKRLLQELSISERHFERRFLHAVGLSPHFYIRVKRFNRAIHLMKAGQFARLTDIAYALNFYDQAHFIRDTRAFSGLTPKGVSQRADAFEHEQSVLAYL